MNLTITEISLKLMYFALIFLTIFMILNFETVLNIFKVLWAFFLLVVLLIWTVIGG